MKPNYWFIFQNERLVISKNPQTSTPFAESAITSLKEHFICQHHLKHIQSDSIYTAELSSDFFLPDTLETIPLKKALERLGDNWYAAGTTAYSIINWDKNHQYCGRCAYPTVHTPDTFERKCTQCGLTFYPRISPSVIVLIERDTQLLMARSPHFTPGVYGLIAGFVETGESLEDAVHREVKEEVGITIKNLRYIKSQSWPFPDSLMAGFFADYSSGELVIDHQEIEAAGWYRYDNLPGRPSSNISIASQLINQFVEKHRR